MRRQRDLTVRLSNLHQSGVDWKARTIWIIGDLTEDKGFQYVPSLRLMDESSGDIKVVIMSTGGDEGGGFAIYDTIKSMKNKVVTIGYGHVFSIAALIFQAGSERFISPNCEIMMHNGTLNIDGGDINTDTIEQLADEAKKNNLRYHTAISKRSGVSLQKIQEWCKEERYIGADMAVKEGLADKIITDWKDLK